MVPDFLGVPDDQKKITAITTPSQSTTTTATTISTTNRFIEMPPEDYEEYEEFAYELYDLQKSTCTKDGVTFEDLEEVPSEDCNECFCDFGVVVCTEG